ncbi:hypothetical protein ACFE04_024339 [Oxalis oulophora]
MESKTTTTTRTKSKYMMMMMMELRSKLKRASLLYLDGFLDACCLHRVVKEAFDSNWTVFPSKWLHFPWKALWFYPLYLFSLILSTLWYNDIAKFSFAAMGRSGPPSKESSTQNEAVGSENSSRKPVDLGGVMIGIGEQLYSLLLLTTFFLETGNLTGVCFWTDTVCREGTKFPAPDMDEALVFWPYPSSRPLWGMFVLTATGSSADDLVLSQRKQWSNGGLGRFPIFYVADTLSMRILSLISLESQNQAGNKAQ